MIRKLAVAALVLAPMACSAVPTNEECLTISSDIGRAAEVRDKGTPLQQALMMPPEGSSREEIQAVIAKVYEFWYVPGPVLRDNFLIECIGHKSEYEDPS